LLLLRIEKNARYASSGGMERTCTAERRQEMKIMFAEASTPKQQNECLQSVCKHNYKIHIVGEDASENNLLIMLLLHGATPAGDENNVC